MDLGVDEGAVLLVFLLLGDVFCALCEGLWF